MEQLEVLEELRHFERLLLAWLFIVVPYYAKKVNIVVIVAHTQLFAIVSVRPFIVLVTLQIHRFIIRVVLDPDVVPIQLANT